MQMFRRTYAEVNIDHLEFNLQQIRQHYSTEVFLCPMVKANAYGHGDAPFALNLERLGVKYLGVCLIEEGLLLRNSGVRCEILVFRGFDAAGAKTILQHKLTPVVSSWEQLDYLDVASEKAISLHLKFDTGMNRLGFSSHDAEKILEKINSKKKWQVKSILTHLVQGEDGVDVNGRTVQQTRELQKICQVFSKHKIFMHALNSAGIISQIEVRKKKQTDHPLYHLQSGLRPGLMIYGYNPLGAGVGLELKPVMSLKSQASVFRQIKAGETVSYNGTWKAKKDSIIAVVPIGYADGYHRLLSNQNQALFAEEKVPVVGNVCMDYLMLDVTEVVKKKKLSLDQEHSVVLFGFQGEAFLSAEEVAKNCKSITWEMLTSVGERVPRVYVGKSVEQSKEVGADL